MAIKVLNGRVSCICGGRRAGQNLAFLGFFQGGSRFIITRGKPPQAAFSARLLAGRLILLSRGHYGATVFTAITGR